MNVALGLTVPYNAVAQLRKERPQTHPNPVVGVSEGGNQESPMERKSVEAKRQVAQFFTARSAHWRDLYYGADFDARNFQLRGVSVTAFLEQVQPQPGARLLDI